MKNPRYIKWSPIMLLFVMFGLCSTMALAQSKTLKRSISAPTRDVSGWQNTRWGMNMREVQRVFSNFATSSNGRVAQDSNVPTLSCQQADCILFNYKVAGELIDVFLTFDTKTNGLIEVSLTDVNRKHATPGSVYFDKLEELLIIKYGVSKYRKDQNSRGVIHRTREWLFASTNIKLKLIQITEASAYTEIVFKRASESDKPASRSDVNKL